MHNLHLVVVKANTPKDACDKVESYIVDFGDENNWRTICGCVSDKNKVYHTSDGRFEPDEHSNTIEKINAMVMGWLKPEEDYYDKKVQAVIDGKKPISSLKTDMEWYGLEKYAAHMGARAKTNTKNFNVLKDSFNDYQYDDNGVTHIDAEENVDLGKGKNTYVVFVDMHS